MDVEEQSIIEEYGSSLEDLTFNSKPLINVLTMLAEENSQYAKSVTKLIEERIYKVPQQHKLPSLYLLDSIIKNVGGTYLNLIAQVMVKVFVAVFEKGDEKTRKDLYKLRHTWPQYFSAKVLHDVDVQINKLDPGWPITAVPPPSPSIHVNPKFLKKAEVTTPQLPVNVPDVSKDEEKELLLEHQRRLSELQRLQDEQLRLTEQEIQEHQLKRDLILKKQEQERKALLTQQQQLILSLRLESELGKTESSEKPSQNVSTSVSTVAETTPLSNSITSNRDPRLARQEQAPLHDNNNGAQHLRLKNKNSDINNSKVQDPRKQPQSSTFQKTEKHYDRTHHTSLNSNHNKRSRSHSPLDERGKKSQHHEDIPKNQDTRPNLEKHHRGDRQKKRRRSLDGSESVKDTRTIELDKEKQGPVEGRPHRGRGFNSRGRGRNGRPNREEWGVENREQRGRGKGRGRQRGGHQSTRGKDSGVPGKTKHKLDDSFSEIQPNLVHPDSLESNQDMLLGDATPLYSDQDQESAAIPQELTLEHKGVILEEAKRRLDAGHITQDQYIELIDKLAEFYELQRQQELEAVQEIHDRKASPFRKEMADHTESRDGNQRGMGGRRFPRKRRVNEGPRYPRRDGPPRKEPRMEEPWRRMDRSGGFEGPPRPNRIVVEEQRRDLKPGIRDGPQPMDGPGRPTTDRPGPPLIDRGGPEIDRKGRPHMDRGGPPEMFRPGPPHMDRPGPPEVDRPGSGPWRGDKHERVHHDHGPSNKHHVFREGHPPDEGHPGHFIPPHMDDRDIRGPNFHGGPSFDHGRPVEHVLPGHPGHGPLVRPMGPGHEAPHDRPAPHQGHVGPQGPPVVHGGPHPIRPTEPGLQLPGQPPQGPPHLGTPHIQHLEIPAPGSPQRPGTDTPPMSMATATPPTPSRMDKRTVDDLFSRLVQVGIIKVAEEPTINTPPRIGTPPLHPNPILPHSVPSSSSALPQGPPVSSQPQPVAPISFQKLQEMINKSREVSTKIPQIELHVDDLKKRYSGIINMLYEGTQCSSCGLRFAGEAAAFYREHLDWHFRRNRREKDGRRIAHKQWYIPLKDWLEYEEITDPEEKAHSSFFDSAKPEADTSTVKSSQESDGSCPVLSTDSEAEAVCDICQEKFEQFWEENQEEWHYKEAIRVGGKTYHDVCYQDAKSNVEDTTTEAEANLGSQEGSEKESPGVKKEEDPKEEKGESKETEPTVTVVKQEHDIPIVKTEPKVDDDNQKDEDVETKGKVKVKTEVMETTDSEIKIKEENNATTNDNENDKNTNKSNTTSSDDK